MKKMLILVAVVSLVAGAVFAEEATLIDFGLLGADTRVGNNARNYPGDDANDQNQRTLMKFSDVRYPGTFTDEQKNAMETSLAIQNWEVQLSSSSRTITNMINSFTREATSKQWGKVMGVRVHFPLEAFNSSALIKPPFEIPAYEPLEEGNSEEAADTNTRFEDKYGVLKNVGTIKSVAVNVYGLNFPYGLWVNVIDDNGTLKSMAMGNMKFDGWGELRWDNPAYIQEVRNRDLRLYPLYPDSMPFIKFAGFEVKRDASQIGGDFITSFKDVKVIYDKAVLDTDRDIDDEALWQIINARETARKLWQMERFGQMQLIRSLDFRKQATESTFTPTPTNDGQQGK
ncbi:MAG: flagellar filament outer layer protein FlaA [Treponema sp.]|jgi:hypothetical protein|nr:flagellar filament outer layer protein FlaA [Treponema sp.]